MKHFAKDVALVKTQNNGGKKMGKAAGTLTTLTRGAIISTLYLVQSI
jgi:hypothetical protein